MIVYEIVNGKLASLIEEGKLPKSLKTKMEKSLENSSPREIKIIVKDGKKKLLAEIYVYGQACIHSLDKDTNALKSYISKKPKNERQALPIAPSKCLCVRLPSGGYWCF